MSKIIKIIICLQILVFTSCVECFFHSGKKGYGEIAQIPRTDESERTKKFLAHPPETQIDIYLYASDCANNPSVTGLFTKIGKDRIPDIVKRIQASKSEKDKYFLIEALSDMNWECHCLTEHMIEILSSAQSEISVNDVESQKMFKNGYKSYLEHIINQMK